MLSSLPACSSSAVESAAKETDFLCGGLERTASKCDTAESPEDDESSVTDKESLEESEDELNQDEESSSSYSSSYTESYTSEDLIPIENEEILDKVPENILNDTSFGDIDRAKDLVDDDLQCLLCNNFDHLIPRLDIAIKLEPVVGEPISKSSVLLCTQCDLMVGTNTLYISQNYLLIYNSINWFSVSLIARTLLIVRKRGTFPTSTNSVHVPEQQTS